MPEHSSIDYDHYMPLPFERRLRVFNGISAENRALLMQTHLRRWLAVNGRRLNPAQASLVEECITFVTTDKYEDGRDMAQIHAQAEALRRRAEGLFGREDLVQILSDRPAYIPPV